MLYVAFLRNVNQGQTGNPSTGDIHDAFASAGCGDAVTFQSNGTVVFGSDDPFGVMEVALRALTARAETERDGFCISLADLAAVVDRHVARPDARRCELTLHDADTIDIADPVLIEKAAHRRCVVVDSGHGWVVTANERDHESNATAVVERVTGKPASSRGLPTLIRLLDKVDRP